MTDNEVNDALRVVRLWEKDQDIWVGDAAVRLATEVTAQLATIARVRALLGSPVYSVADWRDGTVNAEAAAIDERWMRAIKKALGE